MPRRARFQTTGWSPILLSMVGLSVSTDHARGTRGEAWTSICLRTYRWVVAWVERAGWTSMKDRNEKCLEWLEVWTVRLTCTVRGPLKSRTFSRRSVHSVGSFFILGSSSFFQILLWETSPRWCASISAVMSTLQLSRARYVRSMVAWTTFREPVSCCRRTGCFREDDGSVAIVFFC